MAHEETVVDRASVSLRHRFLIISFLVAVLIPSALATGYMFTRASDQFQSTAAFSVKSEDMSGGLGALQAFTQITTSSVPDSAILFDFIQSRSLVEKVNADLDLVTIFNHNPSDVVFSLGSSPTAEELLEYWGQMVSVSLDSRTNIIQLEVRAFIPADAVAITEATIRHSSDLVNQLSSIAQDDAMRFASEELVEAEAALRSIRQDLRQFRTLNQIIDPTTTASAQVGVLSALQSQLASSLVERAALASNAQLKDPRIDVLDNRINAIRSQISSERAAIAETAGDGASLTEAIGQYEELLVDLEFAQNAYTLAMAAVQSAQAEARRQSRYLAVHVSPFAADESLTPNRWVYSGIVTIALLAAWSMLVLLYYNVRERG